MSTFYNPSPEDTYLCSFIIDSENHVTVYDWNNMPFVCVLVPEHITTASRVGMARFIRSKLWYDFVVYLVERYREEHKEAYQPTFTADSLRLLQDEDGLFFDEMSDTWWDSWPALIRELFMAGCTKQEIRDELLYSDENEEGSIFFSQY
ncbi:hypothetical protein M3603_15360 [Rummeliibacillus stabekisii]|uniref:hypothetical protein n=1 Tax=Rummeliibacillus stabekisii TaxID=241244 RepID=UPI002040E97A|nr:hypothetical protein [Rummeliibacillus stabekisii]MCM3317996.1 hypothetical protein [Rummeliibacillus stabekisii]